MPKYVAFLRAINVGGHTVRMDQLRELFSGLGFQNVETFIASGNVIFDSPSKSAKALEKKIENCLLKALGYEVVTFVRAASEMASIAAYKPFSDSELNAKGHTLYIGFLASEPNESAKKKVLSLATEVDDLHLKDRELYWLCRTRFSDAQISLVQLAKAVGMPTTIRNSTTVKKIAAKYS
jgi:uncharacterized protein (DUF1697 family)